MQKDSTGRPASYQYEGIELTMLSVCDTQKIASMLEWFTTNLTASGPTERMKGIDCHFEKTIIHRHSK